MHLKSLTLKGFKSFASATTLKFEPGICAVVGPNGSGKSNVVDALVWVMGEQGAKTLRGAKMDDVIFAGAGDRKPLGRAEVTLSIDNSDGALDIAYSEVSITRRMFRDGASEYEINGSKARLMDIQELLSDSGIGREMHVVVGQGRLAQILDSKPEDRRSYIEEAAGVLKYRRRKEKAERKIVHMQANLDRLQDLTDELKKQLKPLARQAATAQRARTVQAEVRQTRLDLGVYHIRSRRRALETSAHAHQIAAAEVAAISNTLGEERQRLTIIEEENAQAEEAARRAQEMWFQFTRLKEQATATARIANDRQHSFQPAPYSGRDPEELSRRANEMAIECEIADEKINIATDTLESIREEVVDKEDQAREAEHEYYRHVQAQADRREGIVRLQAQEQSQRTALEAARAEHARIVELNTDYAAQLDEVVSALKEISDQLLVARDECELREEAHRQAEQELVDAEQRLDDLRLKQRFVEKKIAALDSRVGTLRDTLPTAPVEALSVIAPDREGLQTLAEFIQVKPGKEKALGVALGLYQESLAGGLPSAPDIIAALEGSHNEAIERTTIMLEQPQQLSWHLDISLSGGASWLLDDITVAEEFRASVSRLLADVVCVNDLKQAHMLVAQEPRLRAVTVDGEMVGEGWIIFGHRSAPKAIEVHSVIEQALAERDTYQAELNELVGTLEGARLSADGRRVEHARLIAHFRDSLAHVREMEQSADNYKAKKEKILLAMETHGQQRKKAELSLADCEEAITVTRDRLALVGEIDQTPDLSPMLERRDQSQSALAQVKAMEVEALLQLRSLQDAFQSKRERVESLERQARNEREHKIRHERTQAHRKAKADLASTVSFLASTINQRLDAALEKAADERAHCQADLARKKLIRDQLKKAVNNLDRELKDKSARAHSAELAYSEEAVRLKETERQVAEQMGMAIDDLLTTHHIPEDFDAQSATAKLAQAQQDLSALGKVNPLALEEYKALEERYNFLSSQLNDVEKARKDLETVIKDVNHKILQLLTDAWHDVEREFPRVFATLFPGGEGRLFLTDPEHILTTGIEVEARPPGKRVKRLSLLSGGEKSLTALAILVAIFKARPSPFYVMDEVEAALDDVNLRRLIALFEQLREDSQLIVITHQKPTMDIANVLYGVTMRGDGVTKVISQRMNPVRTHKNPSSL
ncbi:chromosome segregation protein SMC [Corynebacterium sp. ES2794-CONJ1]|uniref:chromosome segregation protein SMC n=1 Tax=Corynebacterium sp. ES2794-CONJ1 TaxID=2980553 RepID=UPI0021D8AE10|nr:chromosome segregation protein SMC [Corynebacterium sp. ES2794-CONJ1]MCU9518605.1 chromosome segregation protein SMC [Corynebacterium sp. ES2794-CONJ1]